MRWLTIFALLLSFSSLSFAANRIRVLERGSRTPVEGAQVVLVATGEEGVSDKLGFCELVIADDAKEIAVIILATGYKKLDYKGKPKSAFFLTPDLSAQDEIQVVKKVEQKEASAVRSNTQELLSVPGARVEALAVVNTLPSVQQMPPQNGPPNVIEGNGIAVRGSNASDNLYMADGMFIGNIYHSLGFSIFNPNLVDELEFFAGGFRSEYSFATGGVINVKPRRGRSDQTHGEFALGLPMSGGHIEGPLDEKTTYIASVRRSLFEPLKPIFEANKVNGIPVFYDYQLDVTRELAPKRTLSLAGLGKVDSFDLTAQGDQSRNTSGTFNFNNDNSSHSYSLIYKDSSFDDFSLRVQPMYTREDENINVFGQGGHFTVNRTLVRVATTTRLDDHFTILAGTLSGMSFWKAHQNFSIFQANSNQLLGDIDRGKAWNYRSSNQDIVTANWLELESTFGQFTVIPGVNVAHLGFVKDEVVVDPRATALYRLTDKTTLKFSLGQYSKQPDGPVITFDVPDIRWTKSMHYVGGVEHQVFEATTLQFQGYYKTFKHLVNDQLGFYNFRGSGSAYGGEIFLKRASVKRLFGWMSYAYGRSFRKNLLTGDMDHFSAERPHSVTGNVVYRVAPSFDIGTTLYAFSGRPYSDPTAGVFDSDSQYYYPQYDDARNNKRLPADFRFDVQAEYRFIWDTWQLAAWINAFNAYGKSYSPEYSDDFARKKVTSSSFFLPLIGLRASF